MKRILMLVVFLIGAAGSDVHAAAAGTAWGVLTAPPSCNLLASGPICFLTLQATGDSEVTQVACTSTSYVTWCARLQYQETVILSYVQRTIMVESGHEQALVPDGTTLTHYCYPGPCGR